MITPISPASGSMPVMPPVMMDKAGPTQATETPFVSMIDDVMKQAEASQVKADTAVQQLMSGQTNDIHQVMLAMEQARLSMMMMVEVRNKVVEAYQELSRMPL